MASLGVPLLDDPNRGFGVGASIAPSSLHPQKQSRWDARTAYLDAIDRPNLHLATEQTVTRILIERSNTTTPAVPPFGQLRRASGVEVRLLVQDDTPDRSVLTTEQFASASGDNERNVTCSKEVILAAGALVSPVLLQVSGLGPAKMVRSINVTVQVDLPGVGENFQDHPMVGAFYKCECPCQPDAYHGNP